MQDTVDEHAALSSLRQAPADLVAVGLCVVVVSVATLPAVEATLLGTTVLAAFVGFVPGYALVAALFPATGAETTRTRSEVLGGRITRLERVALSIAASCGLLVIVAGSVGDTAVSTARVLTAVTVGLVVVAAIRRLAFSPSERFGRPATEWIDALYPDRLLRPGGDLLSTVAVGFVVLFVLSSAAYAMAPVQEDGYTELYLLHDSDDAPLAAEYPDELTVGEEESLIVGIGNEEGDTTIYTVVVQLQDLEDGTSVQSSTELDRLETTLEGGESVETEHTVVPERSGENLRLTYLLYIGDPPENPSEENAYRSTYVWVDVTDGGG